MFSFPLFRLEHDTKQSTAGQSHRGKLEDNGVLESLVKRIRVSEERIWLSGWEPFAFPWLGTVSLLPFWES